MADTKTMRGGKRAGAGRKARDNEERTICSIRVSHAEREAVKQLLNTMRNGQDTNTSREWCKLSKEKVEAELKRSLDSYADYTKRNNESGQMQSFIRIDIYCQMLGLDISDVLMRVL